MLRLTFAPQNSSQNFSRPGDRRPESSRISTRPGDELLEIIICDSKVMEVRSKASTASEAAGFPDSN